ncbi:DNA polymerase IV [bacterium]|nr:DNA polymerase IV [bacterium]
MKQRSILHVDMDAFFASIAQRDYPEYRGKPVIIGGHSTKRGVVASASYEARAFGVRSAMPLYKAYELCPHATRLPVEMNKYREVNAQLREIWSRFSPVVEPVSFDEAYLDLTGTEALLGPAAGVAEALRAAILKETGLSASVGGGTSKLLAKIASKEAKPAGVYLIPPGEEMAWLSPRDVAIVPGVGERTKERLYSLNIKTIGQLLDVGEAFLTAHFGAQGADLALIAQGQDPRPVSPGGPPKSMGGEETFDVDSTDPVFLRRMILKIACELGYRMRKHGLTAATVTAKVRYGKTFETVERSKTLPVGTDEDDVVYDLAWQLLISAWDGRRPLRLIGASVSNFRPNAQLALFSPVVSKGIGASRDPDALYRTMDQLRDRFGQGAVRRGTLLENEGSDRPASR